jgi:hypothetical protein
MMRRLLANRALICLALSAVGGTVGVSEWPFPADVPVLAVIHDVKPTVYAVFHSGYLTLWFTSAWLLLYVGTSLPTISPPPRPTTCLASRCRRTRPQPRRQELCLILGEQHHRLTPLAAFLPVEERVS